jgi:predicted CopG family antitoxin
MKKKLTLTIDSDVYDQLGYLPRKVSISEITTFVLRVLLEQTKKGRELTDKEFDTMLETAGGKEFAQGVRATFGPTFEKIENGLGTIKKMLRGGKKK